MLQIVTSDKYTQHECSIICELRDKEDSEVEHDIQLFCHKIL